MTNKASKHPKRKTLIAIALLLSVALNLVLVAALPGMVLSPKNGKHFGPMALGGPHGDLMDEKLLQVLQPADAALFRDTMQGQIDNLLHAHAQMHEAMKAVAAAYERDPVDPAALQVALDRAKQAKDALDSVVAKIILDSNAKLSADGRHRLAEMTR